MSFYTIESGMKRSADKLSSPVLIGKLQKLSGSAETMADGAIKLLRGDRIPKYAT